MTYAFYTALILSYEAGGDGKTIEDLQDLFKEMIASVVNQELEGELDEELGYGKYNFRNKSLSCGYVDIQAPIGMALIGSVQTTCSTGGYSYASVRMISMLPMSSQRKYEHAPPQY